MKKILVAEDNDSNFILMTYILKKFYVFEPTLRGLKRVPEKWQKILISLLFEIISD